MRPFPDDAERCARDRGPPERAPAPPDVLYVSPHPDDAVFSAGGSIALDVAAGRRVAVLTLFSDGPEAEARRREDRAAIGGLGAAWLDARLPDAPVRQRAYRWPSALFAPLDPSAKEAPRLVAEIARAIEAVGAAEVIGPLGVGRHVDHQLATAGTLLAGAPRTSLYEDLPYGLAPYVTARRRRELGDTDADEVGGTVRAYLAVAAAWMRQPLVSGLATPLLSPLMGLLIARASLRPGQPRPGHRRQTLAGRSAPRSGPGRGRLREERRDITATYEAKLAALACYSSQWPLFYPSLAAWRDALARQARHLGAAGPIERRFHVDSGG